MDFSDFDLQTQDADLQRRKSVLEALTKRSLSPNLADAVMGLFGKGSVDQARVLQETLARDSATHNQRYQGQMGQELNAYMDKMQGAPERPPSPDYSGQAVGPAVPAQAPNPREAIVRAMTSQLPEMQAMGKASMSVFGKPQEISEHVINGQLVRSDKRSAPQVVGNYGNEWGAVENLGAGGDGRPLMGQRNKSTGEIRYAPQGQQINIDNKGQSKLQDAALKAMEDSRGQVVGAQRQLEAAQRVLQLSEDPEVTTGFGAGALTGIAALGAKLGFNGPEGVAKTQALMTDLSQKTLDAGQQMKGSFSDSDIKFLTDVAAGKVDYNAQTIQHMAMLAYTAGHNTLQNALGQYHGAKGTKGLEGAEKIFPLPNVSYDAKISDRPGFRVRDGGYLSYDGVPGKVKATSKAANGGPTVSNW